MNRRNFVRTAGLAGAAGLLGACRNQATGGGDCGPGITAESVEWKMVTAWPRDFPALGTGANRLAEKIGKLSNGRLTVKVYGGNELVPPFEVFDAVERGTAEMGHGAPYYWKGKVPSTQFFAGVPFGMTAREMNGWLYYGGGLELWHEAYAPFGILPFPVGNSGVQMGGWFNKEINSMADLQGLKMRIPGLGGEVLSRAGGTPLTIPVAEIFTALQTGTIDATEWIGPFNDQAAGLYRAARYYYYPGWHEPGTVLEGLVNREAFEALTPDLQEIVVTACKASTMDMLSEFSARNGDALASLQEQGVEIRAFPEDVLAELRRLTEGVLEDIAGEDVMSAKVYESFKAHLAKARRWTEISETVMLQQRMAQG
ncbi:MAG: twin-arginine translocation signal domain-containing protein [Xanthomonadales bacterium]|nr:TRAP transporter substrate-binding protein [Xanthomonadales bacterium]NIX11561.1 twin-arginine translocation signal domain-containing protein [Xanthomonadales bacterium]